MQGADATEGGRNLRLAEVFASNSPRGSVDAHDTGRQKAGFWQMVLSFIRPFNCVDWILLLLHGLVGRNFWKYYWHPISCDGVHSACSRDFGP